MSDEEVTLRAVEDAGGSRHLSARFTEDGALVISGQDLGPAVEERFGSREYEYAWTVPADQVPALVDALGGDGSDDVLELLRELYENARPGFGLRQVLDQHGIDAEFWSRIG